MTLGVAAPLDRRPRLEEFERLPTSTMSEATLLAGYAGAAVEEPCLCGGRIVSQDSPRAIAFAVEAHNASPDHVAWAYAAGWR